MVFEKNIDAYVLFDKAHRKYFLGVDTSFGAVIISKTDKVFVTDFRYEAYAKDVLGDSCEVITSTSGNFFATIASALGKLGASKIGYDETKMTVDNYDGLKKALSGISLYKCSEAVFVRRAVKTDDEVAKITEAQRIAEKALKKTMPLIKPGVTEREVMAELVYASLACGADNMSFDPIIAFGANSARPHHNPSDKRLEKNDIILIDFGVKLDGYCSDMTRSFCLGDPDPKLAGIHGVVESALNYAIAHIKPGMTGHEADSLARELIRANGYDAEFGHGLGHGVGLDIHEMPRVGVGSDTVLREGMVITIEPGIYLEGVGGVRIEQMAVITSDGCRVLTDFDTSIDL